MGTFLEALGVLCLVIIIRQIYENSKNKPIGHPVPEALNHTGFYAYEGRDVKGIYCRVFMFGNRLAGYAQYHTPLQQDDKEAIYMARSIASNEETVLSEEMQSIKGFLSEYDIINGHAVFAIMLTPGKCMKHRCKVMKDNLLVTSYIEDDKGKKYNVNSDALYIFQKNIQEY